MSLLAETLGVKRDIEAPEQEFLTAEEAAAWLRIDPDDFLEFVKLGMIPPGLAYGKRKAAQRWPWMDLVSVAHLFARGFLLPTKADENRPKPG